MGALEIAGLIAGIVGALVGIIAIGISFGFFRAGHEVSIATLRALAEIGKSTHTTETSSIPIINKMLELLSSGVTANLELSRASVEEAVERILTDEPAIKGNDEAIDRLRRGILAQLSTAFRSVEYKTSAMSPIAASEPRGTATPHVVVRSLPPAVPRVIRWIARHENRYDFFSVKYLRERIFRADPAAQEALQYCIDAEMLVLGQRETPGKPAFPTTTCVLNREHPSVGEILRGTG